MDKSTDKEFELDVMREFILNFRNKTKKNYTIEHACKNMHDFVYSIHRGSGKVFPGDNYYNFLVQFALLDGSVKEHEFVRFFYVKVIGGKHRNFYRLFADVFRRKRIPLTYTRQSNAMKILFPIQTNKGKKKNKKKKNEGCGEEEKEQQDTVAANKEELN